MTLGCPLGPALVAVTLALTACSSDPASPSAGAWPPSPLAAGVDAGLGPGAFANDYATSPAFFTRMNGRRLGLAGSPHNLVQIWYSKNLESLVDLARFKAPVGSVAIKAQDRSGTGQVENVFVMVKQPAGFDPEHGDWAYEERAADGTLQPPAGKIDFCIGCHMSFVATDRLPGVVLRDR